LRRQELAGKEREFRAIGTLNEGALHAQLKDWYRRSGDRVEQVVDGFVVDLVRGDLLEGLPRDLDLIVANLPYLAPDTSGYEEEPEAAVFSTGDGLDHYRRLIAAAGDHLSQDGAMMIQFDGNVLEAERNELPWLLARLESLVATAA